MDAAHSACVCGPGTTTDDGSRGTPAGRSSPDVEVDDAMAGVSRETERDRELYPWRGGERAVESEEKWRGGCKRREGRQAGGGGQVWSLRGSVEVAARCSGRPEGRHVERRAATGPRVRQGGAFGGRVGSRCARGPAREEDPPSVTVGVWVTRC